MTDRQAKIPTICVGDYVTYMGKSLQVLGVVRWWDHAGREQKGYFCGAKRGKRYYFRGANSFKFVVRRAASPEERSRRSEPGQVVSLADKRI